MQQGYGTLEIGIGFYALVFEDLVKLGHETLPAFPWLQAFLLLLVPTALMGATLPLLARAAAETHKQGTRVFGSLYAVSTMGAVAGALITTFYLLEHLGLRGSVQAAALVNLSVGGVFWLLNLLSEDQPRREATPPERADEAARKRGRVLFALFLAGFVGLGLEVASVRLLVYFLEGFTIAFGLMLATYLLGLGLGAFGGTWLALRTARPRRLLAILLGVEALLVLLIPVVLPALGEPLEAMRRAQAEADSIGGGYALGLFLGAAVVLIPVTFCGGALLPVVARLALKQPSTVGRDAGTVYAASTLGAVLGPPVVGFLLIPGIGAPGTVVALGVLLLVAAALVHSWAGPKSWVPAAVFTGTAAVLVMVFHPGRPIIEASHVFTHARSPRRLLAFEEGRTSGVSVVEDLRRGTRLLYTDGFLAAETGRKYGYMRMLGHLPVLMHPDPRRVLVIAFGTGTTAGAVSVHPEVQELVCVEIEEAVYRMAPWFMESNRGVLDDRRTQAVVADGREFIAREQEPFDVVTLEPLMPYTPAAVHLYTREFYESVRERLARGGLLCQWIPIHAMSVEDFRVLVASVEAVFDHTSLWYFEQSAVVLAGDMRLRPDPGQLTRRMANPEVAADLERAFVGDAAHLLACMAARDRGLKASLRGAAPMSDDRTTLEFRPLPRRFGRRSARYKSQNLRYLADLHARGGVLSGPRSPLLRAEAGARVATGAVLASLALEAERVYASGLVVPASGVRTVLEGDPGCLLARSVYERRAYGEMLAMGRPDSAARLTLAPDRSAAFLALAQRSEGEARIAYWVRALQDNALLPPALLRELAEHLEGPEAQFCLNRAAVQEGGPAGDPAEERQPRLRLAPLTPLLEAGDFKGVKRRFLEAREAGLLDVAEDEAGAWFDGARDPRQAAALLDAADS
ncbi:MAG: fused MFS/spermidine synthase, partial [Planctomycetota bacterium]